MTDEYDELIEDENFLYLLIKAAKEGNEKMCEFAKDSEERRFYRMCSKSASDNSVTSKVDTCILSLEWGAKHFNLMLVCGASEGHEHICRLAKKWGATDMNAMYFFAKNNDISELAKEWGGKNDDKLTNINYYKLYCCL